MKKILAVFEGSKYSDGASKYAIEIARSTGSMLVGVFIQDLRYLNFTYASLYDQPYIDITAIENSKEEMQEKINLNIKLFQRACDSKGVHHKVHLDKGVPIQEVIKESVFADILVIDSHTGFSAFGEKAPDFFLKDLLTDSHCPVLIVPPQYSHFDKALLCYDGTPSSVYAIKQFAYLFPELQKMETIVVSVNQTATNHLNEGSNLKELVKQHFADTNYVVLNGDVEEELISFLKNEGNNLLIVMGAYGRNALSRLFHQSLSNRILQELNMPLFVTHE